MTTPEVLPALLGAFRVNLRSIVRSLICGLAASLITIPAQLAWESAALFPRTSWLRSFGLPIAWMGILKAPQLLTFLNMRFYFYWWSFIQNCLFWAALFFALFFMRRAIWGDLPLLLLPTYVVGLAWARIQLEFQMAIAAMGPIVMFARIDPFSGAQITAYFSMALLLFPTIITLVSGLPFREVFRLSSVGLPVILMPPFLDNYILRRPLIYNFFTPEFYNQAGGPLNYLTILSPGIKFEIVFVSTFAFAYLVHRTHSVLRSAVAMLAFVFVFVPVSSPIVTSQFHLCLSQPQLFAGYLILTYILTVVGLGLADRRIGGTILKRIRVRGIHFPAMVLFGSFLVHPAILATNVPEDFGLIIASTFVVFLVWQTAVVFDDIDDRDVKAGTSGYLGYGMLTAIMALLAAIPFGPVPWLLTFAIVCLAMSYPRLRRRHYLLSGVIISGGTCIAFLIGALVRLNSPSSPQPVGLLALAIFVVFSGGSLLKDITDVEGDKRCGIQTIFTRFETRIGLLIVASFVAVGFVLPAVFLHALVDRALFLAMGIAAWVLIVLAKDRSYKPVLMLYFVEGVWVFIRLFVIGSS